MRVSRLVAWPEVGATGEDESSQVILVCSSSFRITIVFPAGQMLVLSGLIFTTSSAYAGRLKNAIKIVDLAILITDPRAQFADLPVEDRIVGLAGFNAI